MGLFGFLFGHEQVIITEDSVIVLKGERIIIKERPHHHHHHPHGKLVISELSLFLQDNPDFIISKTQGQIMAQQFGKAQGVNYSLAFLKDNQTPGDIDPSSIDVESSDPQVITIVPDVDGAGVKLATGKILGVADGAATAFFTAKNKSGVLLSANLIITVADEVVPANDATSIAVTLSDPFNQDSSPVTP